MHVLLVEDNAAMVELTTLALEMSGHQVTAASSGPDALQLARDGLVVDVVIQDHFMPGMDGLVMLQQLRQIPHWQDIPVVIATGADQVEAAAMVAIAPGPVTLLSKPFTPEVLLELLDKLGATLSATRLPGDDNA